LILRTDFSNQATWDETRAEIRKPVGTFGFLAYMDFLENVDEDGIFRGFPEP
jgi:hypothetical protein